VKVIAFSLWGDDPRYTLGALQNASLAKIVYPGWVCRFYVGKSTPQHIIDLLHEFGNVDIYPMEEQGDWRGMFWRFAPASDPNVDVLVVRDCDSRLWFREKGAVDEWLQSDKDFHIMRDHPYHAVPILGGMWGVRGDLLKEMDTLIDQYQKGDFWQVDQNFLKEIIYSRIQKNVYIHDSSAMWHKGICTGDEKHYPSIRDPYHFVGQAYAGSGKVLDAEEYFQDFMRREYDAQK